MFGVICDFVPRKGATSPMFFLTARQMYFIKIFSLVRFVGLSRVKWNLAYDYFCVYYISRILRKVPSQLWRQHNPGAALLLAGHRTNMHYDERHILWHCHLLCCRDSWKQWWWFVSHSTPLWICHRAASDWSKDTNEGENLCFVVPLMVLLNECSYLIHGKNYNAYLYNVEDVQTIKINYWTGFTFSDKGKTLPLSWILRPMVLQASRGGVRLFLCSFFCPLL